MVNKAKKFFNRAYFQKRGKLFPEFKGFVFALLIRLFLKPKKLLDVGCARGELVKWAARWGIETRGIDISGVALKEAGIFVQQHCRRGDILNLSFKNSQFEAVSCLALMEHIAKKDVNRALTELLRATKKYILLQICVKDNPFEGKHYLLDPTHANVEPSSWWLSKFRQLAFKIRFTLPKLGLFLLEKAGKNQSPFG